MLPKAGMEPKRPPPWLCPKAGVLDPPKMLDELDCPNPPPKLKPPGFCCGVLPKIPGLLPKAGAEDPKPVAGEDAPKAGAC